MTPEAIAVTQLGKPYLFTNVTELLQYLDLSDTANLQLATIRNFPLRVPLAYAKRMVKEDPNDPLLRQVLPLALETQDVPGFTSDPVEDLQYRPVAGLIHKYRTRVLLITTGACRIHCRYCFRREYPYQQDLSVDYPLDHIAHYIRQAPEINEVILSGGDPLTLSERRLHAYIAMIESIPHVQLLRLHTRQLIVEPASLGDALLDRLKGSRLKVTIVTHANHANEIDSEVARTAKRCHTSGIQLLNQSVLLKGVNDDPEALKTLSYALYRSDILPYYLHMLDRVQGSAHFEVPEEQARGLIQSLQTALPGYLVPRLARDVPGRASKTMLAC